MSELLYATTIGSIEGVLSRLDAGRETAESALAKIRQLLAQLHAAESDGEVTR